MRHQQFLYTNFPFALIGTKLPASNFCRLPCVGFTCNRGISMSFILPSLHDLRSAVCFAQSDWEVHLDRLLQQNNERRKSCESLAALLSLALWVCGGVERGTPKIGQC